MSEILTIGLHAEGVTDQRFYQPLIKRTIEDIVLDCDGEIEIYPILDIPKKSGVSYRDDILNAAQDAYQSGLKCLILHCDADAHTASNVRGAKIDPAIQYVNKSKLDDNAEVCSNLVPLIPVYMTEAWMLADLDLLKEEIGASKFSNQDLGLTKRPEVYSDPKEVIKSAIRTVESQKRRRRRPTTISELYTALGNKIALDKLKKLNSFQSFYEELKSICLPYC